MRELLISALCLYSIIAPAQDLPQSRLIRDDIGESSFHLEQAAHTISAINRLAPTAQAEYKAGKSVILLPGFEVKSGASFVAHVGTISVIATIEGKETPLTVTTYPNPFERTVTIAYTLQKEAHVTLFIADSKGNELNRLVDNQLQPAGQYNLKWNSDATLAAGSYICILNADKERISNRLIRK